MPRKKPAPEPSTLIAIIEAVEQSYFISEHRGQERAVSDEAILEVTGKIEEISPRHRRYLGHQIEMTLACSRSFLSKEPTPPADKPFMLFVNLKKDRCSLMAYLPADAFWALPSMIGSKAVTHIEVSFGDYHYGRADLLSLHFAPASKLGEFG